MFEGHLRGTLSATFIFVGGNGTVFLSYFPSTLRPFTPRLLLATGLKLSYLNTWALASSSVKWGRKSSFRWLGGSHELRHTQH